MNFEVVIKREAQIDLDEIFVWVRGTKAGTWF